MKILKGKRGRLAVAGLVVALPLVVAVDAAHAASGSSACSHVTGRLKTTSASPNKTTHVHTFLPVGSSTKIVFSTSGESFTYYWTQSGGNGVWTANPNGRGVCG